ncbi:MAG: hypothetical protein JSR78_16590 [Proteobacteria bacterium]|nr:hypothetical protein [Pseudomonadota bacterium]
MNLRPSLPWLAVTLAAALIAMYLACRLMKISDSAVAAAVFAGVMVMAALRTNAQFWQRSENRSGTSSARDAMRANVFLIGLAFFWCGLAFYAIYLGTHVRWQHGWEYGTACMIFAAAYAYYFTRLANPSDKFAQSPALDRMAKIAGYQAMLIGIGLVWLIASGKLAITHKGDWAANQLFLAGGFAVMCTNVFLIKTNAALCAETSTKKTSAR